MKPTVRLNVTRAYTEAEDTATITLGPVAVPLLGASPKGYELDPDQADEVADALTYAARIARMALAGDTALEPVTRPVERDDLVALTPGGIAYRRDQLGALAAAATDVADHAVAEARRTGVDPGPLDVALIDALTALRTTQETHPA